MQAIDFNPDRQTLRQFGFIATFAFTVLALFAWREWFVFAFGLGVARPWVVAGCLGVASCALVCSLVAPRANRPLFIGMSVLGYPIGVVVSFLTMALLFYCVFTPIAWVFRLVKRDVLGRSSDPKRDTYWVQRNAGSRPAAADYFKQF